MPFACEIETVFFTGSLKWNRTINENDRVIHVMFIAEFRKNVLRDHVCSCRLKLCM